MWKAGFTIFRILWQASFAFPRFSALAFMNCQSYLKTFQQAHPQVDVRVEYRRSSEVYLSVLDGRADIGLVAYPSPRRGLRTVTFWSDRLVLICSPSHTLASRRRIPLSALQGEKFIAFSPDLPTRREIDRKLRSEGVKVKLVLEFDSIETVKRAVEIENGVSIVPEKAVRDEVEAGLLATVAFTEPELQRPLGVLIRRSARVSPALREFLALLEQSDGFGLARASKDCGGTSAPPGCCFCLVGQWVARGKRARRRHAGEGRLRRSAQLMDSHETAQECGFGCGSQLLGSGCLRQKRTRVSMSCRPHQPRRRAAECLEIPQGIKRRTGSGSDPIDSDRIDFNILLSKRDFQ